jgi:hypothetical protein
MSEVNTEEKPNKKLIDAMKLVSSDSHSIQKLINSQKPYFKEAILRCQTYSKFFSLLKHLFASFRSNTEAETDSELNAAYQ